VKRLAFGLVAVGLLLLPGAARPAGCSPLDCAPSQFVIAHGSLLATRQQADSPIRVIDLRSGTTRWRLPPGIVAGHQVVHQDGGLLTWFDAATGARAGSATLQQRARFSLVGTSQDASRAVLARTQARSTTFAIVSRSRPEQTVKLGGNTWSFDALRGSKLFLIKSSAGGYQVRQYDLASDTLAGAALKDPGESATISGVPFARVASTDGRYLFTLYLGSGGGAMVHELDLVAGTARCVDLPGGGDFSAAMTWALVVDPDGRTLWAVSPGYGRVVAVDIAAHRIRDSYAFQRASWAPNPGVAAMAPDGERIAVTDAQHVWFVELARRKVVAGGNHVAIALGFAPDLSRLWVVGERSRVRSLPVR
jgi:hypothetical protein